MIDINDSFYNEERFLSSLEKQRNSSTTRDVKTVNDNDNELYRNYKSETRKVLRNLRRERRKKADLLTAGLGVSNQVRFCDD